MTAGTRTSAAEVSEESGRWRGRRGYSGIVRSYPVDSRRRCRSLARVSGASSRLPPPRSSSPAWTSSSSRPPSRTSEGRLVPGLGIDDFRIFEDGIEQRVLQFTGERVPVSLGIAVDVSDSMFGVRIADARRAIDRFVLSLLDDGRRGVPDGLQPRAGRSRSPWTRPPRGLAGRLDAVKPFGGTAIYDALVKAVPMFDKRRHERCGLLVISDGADTASDARLQDALRLINYSDAFVYAIALDAPPRTGDHQPASRPTRSTRSRASRAATPR